MRWMVKTIIIPVCISILSMPAYSAGGEGEFNPHPVVGVFLGATDPENYSSEFTYGIELGYKFTHKFGVGVIYEETPDGHDGAGTKVALGSLFYSPFAGWRIGAGVGSERVDGHHGKSSYNETLYRLGLAYHFHFGKYGISPSFNVDFIDGDQPWYMELLFRDRSRLRCQAFPYFSWIE